MALLIVLAIIGGLAVLSGLYLIGVEIAAVITAWTSTFGERVAAIREKRLAKKKAKSIIEEQATETAEGNAMDENAPDDEEVQDDIVVDVDEALEEVK